MVDSKYLTTQMLESRAIRELCRNGKELTLKSDTADKVSRAKSTRSLLCNPCSKEQGYFYVRSSSTT